VAAARPAGLVGGDAVATGSAAATASAPPHPLPRRATTTEVLKGRAGGSASGVTWRSDGGRVPAAAEGGSAASAAAGAPAGDGLGGWGGAAAADGGGGAELGPKRGRPPPAGRQRCDRRA